MSSSTSSFLYLPYAEKLADIKKAGIDLDVVERIVVKRTTNDKFKLRQAGINPNFIEDTRCHECGEKIQSQDLVVLDSIFYLWHNHCYQKSEQPVNGIGTHNEVASWFGVFRRNHDENQAISNSTIDNKIIIDKDSKNIV
ncbi:MAG: hypothetical protein ACQEXB_23910 [Bacillota bacterium]